MSIIMWKAMHGCLPVDDRIRGVGIYLVSKCDCCSSGGYEDQNHILALGTFAEQVWRICSLQLGMPLLEGGTWREKIECWYRHVKNSSQSGQLIGILPSIITWRLWWRRYKARMEGEQESVQVVWGSIKYWLAVAGEKIKGHSDLSRRDEEILQLLNLPVKPQKKVSTQIVKWLQPPEGPSGAGGAIRDHRGELISGFSIFTRTRSNNFAEFMGLIQGLRIVRFLGLQNVEIEMDSMLVIEWLRKKRCGLWYLDDYWEELLQLLDGLCYCFRLFAIYIGSAIFRQMDLHAWVLQVFARFGLIVLSFLIVSGVIFV
ncbi:uncharacterized protein LOC121236683 [Juglans microcarpa x Juglans regia]|uniref:uncharacterized protein LOC121236683 n=1 Tax=Juglans microcarpa x Juglans regia TaxID=2249226 RepID=UPI001B7F2C0C|nr:uncharacterized protein LOC121236683 [Juglans microcarpa x Juglans regia]